MAIILWLGVLVVFLAHFPGDTNAAPEDDCICLEEVTCDYCGVTAIRGLGDGSCQLYIAEIEGKIWLHHGGKKADIPFLDLTGCDYYSLSLLSFAFHPQFAKKGIIYALISFQKRKWDRTANVSLVQLTVCGKNQDQIDPKTMKTLITMEGPATRYPRHGGEASVVKM